MPLTVGNQNIRTSRMVSANITEATHGFTVGEPVSYDGSNWVQAKADDVTTEALGLVYEVVDTNTFTYLSRGSFSRTTPQWDALVGTTGGLVAGSDYAVSQTTAGQYETTEPTSGVIQFMFRAISTTEVEVYCATPRFNSWTGAHVHDANLGGFSTVLPAGSSYAEVQAALDAYQIVYLQQGEYNTWGTGYLRLRIPSYTHLIGLSLGYQYITSSYTPRITLSGSNQGVELQAGASIRNVGFYCSYSGTSSASALFTCSYSSRNLIKNCWADFANQCAQNFLTANGPCRVEDCTAYRLPNTSSPGGYVISIAGYSAATLVPYHGVHNCRIYFTSSPTLGSRGGISCTYGGQIKDTLVFNAPGHGFYMTSSNGYQPGQINGCYAYNCGVSTAYHGFYMLGAGDASWLTCINNKAADCNGWGFWFPSGYSGSHGGAATNNHSHQCPAGAYQFSGSFLNNNGNHSN